MLRKGSRAQVRTKSGSSKEIDDRLFIGTLGIDCVGYSERCIQSVASDAKAVKFCYMDNGSTGESLHAIHAWKVNNPDIDEYEIVENGCNAGVGVGWNRLIKRGIEWGATKILICNNDIAFGPHTLDGLCTAYTRLREEIPETVMVTAANVTKNPDDLKNIPQEWNYHVHPDFSCFLITPETIERVGYLSEEYVPAYFEDNQAHHRIILMGYKAWGTDWAPYCHIASRTRYAHPNIVPHDVFRANRVRFYKEMLVDGPDQEVQEKRYEYWIKIHPDQPHPDWKDVLEFCVNDGFIAQEFVDKINAL